MKAALLLLLFSVSAALAQTEARTAFEVGRTFNLRKSPLLYTRLSYSAPIEPVRYEGGVDVLWGLHGGFGFDVIVTRPIHDLEPLLGARLLVWDASLSTGFPVGVRWHYPLTGAELTLGITVAPTVHLAKGESGTVIFDSFIGVRF